MKRLALVASLALVACASPEARVRAALIDAGLGPRVSACMAERMVDRLSLLQLRRLSSLGGLKGRRLEDVPLDEFLHRVRALKDPEILGVVSVAGLKCAVRF